MVRQSVVVAGPFWRGGSCGLRAALPPHSASLKKTAVFFFGTSAAFGWSRAYVADVSRVSRSHSQAVQSALVAIPASILADDRGHTLCRCQSRSIAAALLKLC